MEYAGKEENIPVLEVQKAWEDHVQNLHDIITAPSARDDLPIEQQQAIENWVRAINTGGSRGDYDMYKAEAYTIPPELAGLYSEADTKALAEGAAALPQMNQALAEEIDLSNQRALNRVMTFEDQLKSNQQAPAQEQQSEQSKGVWERVKAFFSDLGEKISNFFTPEPKHQEPTQALQNVSDAVRAADITRALDHALGTHTPEAELQASVAKAAKDNGVPDKAAEVLGLKERRTADGQETRKAMAKNPPEVNEVIRETIQQATGSLSTQDVSSTQDVGGVNGPATQGNNKQNTNEQSI